MKKVVIEVGVNQAQDTQSYLNYFGEDMILYGFEPTYDLLPGLINKFKNDPRVVIVPLAIDEVNRMAKFNIASWHDGGCSSLHQFSDDIHDKWPDNPAYFDKHQNVMTIRLDSFCDLYGIDVIDYIHIDAQGNDFSVLKSLGKYIDVVKEGKLECAYAVNLYKGVDNSFKSITTWLSDRNFKYEYTLDNSSSFAEANIIFKKKS